MSIFKNDNEKKYVGGRKHWTDVIKNQSSSDTFFYKSLEEDFNMNSTLIVMPGEEAFFVDQGKIVQKFTNGTYKLSTKNYPFISRLKNMFSGGVSVFNCIVYFIRKTISYELFWGTDSPIVLRDKILNIATKIKARGSYRIEVIDSEKFVSFFITRNVQHATSESIELFFAEQFQAYIKNQLAKFISESSFELIELSTKTDYLSSLIEPNIDSQLAIIGLKCNKFTVLSIDIEDDALRREYDKIGMEAYKKRVMASADKSVLEILGNDWEKQKKVEIMQTAASNPSGGVGVGIATGIITGKELSSLDDGDEFTLKLKKLKEIYDAGLITKEDYDNKKAEILSKI